MVKQLKSKAEFDEALKSSKLVVFDFTATWCPPCKMIAPKFEAMSNEMPDVDFYKIDVDENEETAQHCKINCMPTFQFYRDGVKVDELQGADENGLRGKINNMK